MIPIGSPVTVTWDNGSKEKGTVLNCYPDSKYFPYDIFLWEREENVSSMMSMESVKIRYDSPAPFTLWQLNALLNENANARWYDDEYATFKNPY